MYTKSQLSRVLGWAFLFQFITSFSSGVFLQPMWYVSDNVAEILIKITARPWLAQANIFLDMLTAFGVTFLGVTLYQVLKKENKIAAFTGMAFYLLEGAFLGVGQIFTVALIVIGRDIGNTVQPDLLLPLAGLFNAMHSISGTLSMLGFCFGAVILYFLLFKSRIVPVAFSLWGLVALLPLCIGTIAKIFGIGIPFYFYTPYIPFELVMGIWFLTKGIREHSMQRN